MTTLKQVRPEALDAQASTPQAQVDDLVTQLVGRGDITGITTETPNG